MPRAISVALMWSPTRSESGSSPRPSELRMSRSLIILGPGYSSSITTPAPTDFSVISLAASRRV